MGARLFFRGAVSRWRAFCALRIKMCATDRQTDKQTNRQTDGFLASSPIRIGQAKDPSVSNCLLCVFCFLFCVLFLYFVLWYVSICIVLVLVEGDGVKRPSPRFFFFLDWAR